MDKTFESVDEILDSAIAREEEASAFYMDLAGAMDIRAMIQVFEDFAKEEQGHKAKLEAVKRGEYRFGAGAGQVRGLGLADYLVEGEPMPNMTNRETHAPTPQSNAQLYAFFEHFLKPSLTVGRD